MDMPSVGVYVHFPWCRERCPYCDFAIAIAPLDKIPHAAWADAVIAELGARQAPFAGHALASIYLGGGTPGLWQPAHLARVLEAIHAAFASTGRPLEVTCEVNPLDCTPEHLAALRSAGVTRLSIGVQSLDARELVTLGRDHDATQARQAVDHARAAGFEQLSCDVIFGASTDLGRLERTLETLVAESVPHLSVYQLTVEPQTTLRAQVARGEVTVAPDDDLATAFLVADARLTGAGYQHYEVSSYARPGARAVHNSRYWRVEPYLGLGNGAHSLAVHADGSGLRWSNHRAPSRYLADPRQAIAEEQPRTLDDLDADRIWLGLRTSDGVPEDARGLDLAAAQPLVKEGLLVSSAGRLRPTARGFLFADALGAKLAILR
jgi:putative oxygen-independent coproporphyrinogen III oxidase